MAESNVISFTKRKVIKDKEDKCQCLHDKDVELAQNLSLEIAKHLAQTSTILVDSRRADEILAHVNYFLKTNFDLD